MIKNIRQLNIQRKTILLRTDYNVAFKKNKMDTEGSWRIDATLATLKYLLKRKVKIIIICHLGRPDGKIVEKLRMEPVAKFLAKRLKRKLKILENLAGFPEELNAIANRTYLIHKNDQPISHLKELKMGNILILENIRFHPGEQKNDPLFIKKLASLGEIFVNDAFGTCHRAEASITGLAALLPAAAGLLLEKEVKIITKKARQYKKPLVFIMGGAKASTKTKVIKTIIKKADAILLGGVLSNTVLAAQGIAIGKSLVDPETAKMSKDLELTSSKLHLPVDVIVSSDFSGEKPSEIRPVGRIGPKNVILDIGPDTCLLFQSIISQAGTIVWNGPMGLIEIKKFARGTEAILNAFINAKKAYKLIGGGETITILSQKNLLKKVDFVSTGGGALLELFAGEKLPGIEILKY